jgi:WD40 repeat protein
MTTTATNEIFVSYADDARAWAEGYLLDGLREAGVRCSSPASFAPGRPYVAELERAVQESARVLLVITPGFLADMGTSFLQLLAVTFGLQTRSWPVIPLLLDPALSLPPSLAILTAIDASDPDSWPAVIGQLCAALDHPPPAATAAPACPYPGLAPFGPREMGQFFGREAEVDAMARHLRHHDLLLVVGPSGSGKSSLISAGLLPALRAGRYAPPQEWVIRKLRPSDPQLRIFTAARPPNPAHVHTLIDTLMASSAGASRVLLVIDQLEELFTQVDRAAQRRYFGALQLLRRDPRCTLLMAMRADFYPDLMDSPLWPIPPSQRIELAPLQGEALERAIRAPAERCAVQIEPRLIERLLRDAADEPGAQPLVQEAMVLLWGRMRRRYIALADYERLGSGGRTGLAAAIATRADATMAQLSAAEQAIACRILLRLVQFGEGRADTRRHLPRAALHAPADSPALFARALQHLVDSRLLTLSGFADPNSNGRGATPTGEVYVDIAHEALLEGWPTLRRWIESRREDEQARRRLEARAAEWAGRSRQGGLLDPVELAEAERWLARSEAGELGHSQQLLQLIEASQAAIRRVAEAEEEARRKVVEAAQLLAEERQERLEAAQLLVQEREGRLTVQRRANRRLRWMVAGLTLAVVSALLLAAYARDQARVAVGRQLAARADGLRDDQLDLAMLLGIEAFVGAGISEARDSLIAAHERSPYLVAFLRRHSGEVNSVSYSQEGALLASAGCLPGEAGSCGGGGIFLWEAASGRPAGVLANGLPGPIYRTAAGPDGRLLAAASCYEQDAQRGCRAGALTLFDLATRAADGPPLVGHSSEVYAVAFSRDGQSLASGARDGSIILWDVAARQARAVIAGAHAGRVASVAFSPDGALLASASWDRSVKIWQAATGAPLLTLPDVHKDVVRAVQFSPAAGPAMLASADLDGVVALWDLSAQPPLRWQLAGHRDQIRGLAFSPDGQLLATGSRDKRIILWNVATGARVGPELVGHTDSVNSLDFSPDGQTLASAGQDALVILWRLGSQRPLLGHPGSVQSAVLSPDGSLIVSAGCAHQAPAGEAGEASDTCGGGQIHRWRRDGGWTPLAPIPAHASRINALGFSPDGTRLASGDQAGALLLWEARAFRPLGPPLATGLAWINALAFNPDGTRLAVAGCQEQSDDATCASGAIQLWNPATLTLIADAPGAHWDTVRGLAFSPDGHTLASAGFDRAVRLWGGADLAPKSRLAGHTNRVYSVLFSPDGRTLASAGADQDVILWDVERGRPAGEPLIGHRDSVYALAFSPDGRTLASAGADGAILFWNPARLRRIGSAIAGHSEPVRSLAFSGDGDTLVSAGDDRAVIAWDSSFLRRRDAESWRQTTCAIVGRPLSAGEWRQYGGGSRLVSDPICIHEKDTSP